jgi:multiple sugar transport system permease protein
VYILSFFKIEFWGGALSFVGLRNYIEIFLNDEIFWISIKNTFIFLILLVPSWIFLSFILAQALYRIKHRRLILSFLILPSVVPFTILATIWKVMYYPSIGLWSFFASFLYGKEISFLSADLIVYGIVLMQVWTYSGYLSIIFLSGLLSIPKDYYEAANLDGANRLNILINITIPLLKPIIFLILFITTIWSIGMIDTIYVMTGGGPAYRTSTILWHAWETGWRFHRLGEASSMVSIFLSLSLLIYYIERKIVGGREYIYG